MLIKALLVSVWAAICTTDLMGPQLSLWRPLIAGTGVGIILGDPTTGLIIAGTLELIWLGTVGIGAYVPPDVVGGSIIGTAIGVLTGEGAVASIAIAVPVAIVCQQLDILWRTINIGFVHRADKAAEEGDLDKLDRYHLMGIPLLLLTRAIPVFLAVYFGANFVSDLFDAVPDVIMDGLSVAGGILPALGFGMLLSLLLSRQMWVFLLLGFVLSAYLNIPIIGIALIAVITAVLYDRFSHNQANEKTLDDNMEGGLE